MKRLLLIALPMLFFMLTFNACEKDPCSDVPCLNGGICNNGSCDCPTGYSGTNCQDFDPCVGINCLNGGICNNGQCDCPSGYTGTDCSVPLTPTSMTIRRVTVTKYPTTKSNGAGWDLSTGPDCFITLNVGTSSNQNDFVSGFTYNNTTSQTLEYNTGFPINLTGLNSDFSLGLWDEDSPDPDDFMDGVSFTPINYTSGFPNSFTLDVGSFAARLDVTWNF